MSGSWPTSPVQANVLGRTAAAIQRQGAQIILRTPGATSGPVVSPSPPTLDNPVVDGNYAAGSTSIAIRGTEAIGQIVAGDQIIIGGSSYTVTTGATNRAFGSPVPGFDGIVFTPPLAAAVEDATPLTFSWQSDQVVYAKITGFPAVLVDGTLVKTEDLQVIIPALNTPRPATNAKLLIGGEIRAVVNVVPRYANGVVISWQLQAR